MRIALLTGNLSNGGAQRVISVLANKLADNYHEVYLFVFAKHEKEYVISPKVNLSYMKNSADEYSSYSSINRLKDVRNFLMKVAPEVAVGFMESGYALFLGARGLNIKTVASVRNHPQIIRGKKGLRGLLTRVWFKSADAVVLQTERQREYVSKWGWRNCKVIPNPLPEDIIEEGKRSNNCLNETPNRILMAGRLHKQKNYEMAIKAFRYLKDSGEQFTVDIFGEGEEKNSLSQMILEYGLMEEVKLCGWSLHIKEEMKNHDVYIMSSDYEGMPNSLMEAMALGMICISTDCFSGPSEIIDDGKSGFLIPVGDSVQLAEIVSKILHSDANTLREMSLRAQSDISEKFAEDIVVDMWEELFKGLIGDQV